ncbi:uncharacterized protein EDB93DRAFT_1257023 [Suillus bovinus]|uniref:uncharacterized protein n=1 Tax=Suillus bovinus TaxID=48563 RepID=UPI001B883A21|nr:uncharacterized protein EDB93DRAFT_1257023 [Suillus bovinus]KAG2127458.1 hypothetical protein EDB93DRAFT_1257023 [Suillus bovinus]
MTLTGAKGFAGWHMSGPKMNSGFKRGTYHRELRVDQQRGNFENLIAAADDLDTHHCTGMLNSFSSRSPGSRVWLFKLNRFISASRRRILGILKEPEEKIHDSLTGKTMTFLSDEYASRTASSLAKNKQRRINLHDREAVEEEIIARAERNLKRANRRMDENYIEEVSDDEHFLDESNVQETAPVVKPSIPSFIADAVDFIGSLTPTTRSILASMSVKA